MKLAPVLAIALAVTACAGGAAYADGAARADGANLRAALSVLPDTVFSAASPDVARFLTCRHWPGITAARWGARHWRAPFWAAASARSRRWPSPPPRISSPRLALTAPG